MIVKRHAATSASPVQVVEWQCLEDFFVHEGAADPQQQVVFDAHAPDVCTNASPPNLMTCRRAPVVFEHFLLTFQKHMCKHQCSSAYILCFSCI